MKIKGKTTTTTTKKMMVMKAERKTDNLGKKRGKVHCCTLSQALDSSVSAGGESNPTTTRSRGGGSLNHLSPYLPVHR